LPIGGAVRTVLRLDLHDLGWLVAVDAGDLAAAGVDQDPGAAGRREIGINTSTPHEPLGRSIAVAGGLSVLLYYQSHGRNTAGRNGATGN
jgi:hypothetical protein